jgi:predicted enzyme related to lactoylglutathione lyase
MKKSFIKQKPAIVLFILLFSQLMQAAEVMSVSVPPINQPPSGQRIPGKIIWHDLVTTKVSDAQQFYGDVFGWQFKTFGTGEDSYTMISHGGKRIGGIVPLTNEAGGQNENQWISYISVANVDHAIDHVTNNAGKVLFGPMRFEQLGELAVFTDPEGAAFGVLASSSGDPADSKVKSGGWVWADIMVNEPAQQIKFYQGLANYTVKEDTQEPQFPEYHLYTNRVPRAAVVPIPPTEALPKILPNWLPYLHVANLNETLTKVTANGGKLLVKPNTRVYNGKLAIIADPGDAAVGIVQMGQ